MHSELHTLTDVELSRRARTSDLMDDPLFAELATRFDASTKSSQLKELEFQQSQMQPRKPADRNKV